MAKFLGKVAIFVVVLVLVFVTLLGYISARSNFVRCEEVHVSITENLLNQPA